MSYPPEHHLLRDLPFEIEDTGEHSARAHVRMVPELRTRPTGPLAIGPLLVATDVLSGFLVGQVIAPDWLATAQLSVHLVDGPLGASDGDGGDGPDRTAEVVVDATVRRAGRTTIVVEAEARDADSGADVGEGVLTFVRLPRREGNIDMADTPVAPGRRTSMALPGSGFTRPYRDEIGVEVLDAPTGSARLVVSDYVRNSFGAVNGGVVTSLAAEAAAALAGAARREPARALDVSATYVSQGKAGPLVTRSRLLRSDGSTALVRVEVVDSGRSADGDGRLLVVAHVHCGPA